MHPLTDHQKYLIVKQFFPEATDTISYAEFMAVVFKEDDDGKTLLVMGANTNPYM